MTETLSHEPPRDEIEDLLPWYANGRLGSRDHARVEAALAVDADLVRRLGLIREEMAASIEANEAIETPSTKLFDRVLAGMAPAATPAPAQAATAEPAAAVAAKPSAPTTPAPATPDRVVKALTGVKAGLMERLAIFVESFSPRSLAFAGLAAVAIVVAQGAALTGMVLERGDAAIYRTASQTPVATGGTVVLIAFVPEAKIADVAAFLKRHDAQILEGPRANGFFKIRVAPAKGDAASVAEAMRRETELVTFAQPSS